MKIYSRITALVLALCLMATAFTGCGKETPAETAAPTEEPTVAPAAQEVSFEPDLDSPFYAAVAILQENVAQCKGYNLISSAKGDGIADGIYLELDTTHSRYQNDESGNINTSYSAIVESDDVYCSYRFFNYFMDGVYYSCDSLNNKAHICTEPSVSPVAAPGSELLNLLMRCPKKDVSDADLLCTLTLKGDDMKHVVADLLPTLYSEIDPAASWANVSGELTVDLYADAFSGIGFFETIQISSPSLGALLMRSAKPGCVAECGKFDIQMNINYRGNIVPAPFNIEHAVPGKPFPVLGLNHGLKTALGVPVEEPQIPEETEPAETFTPVIIVDHESTLPNYFPGILDQPTEDPAPVAPSQIPEPGKNTIALSDNNCTVLFSIPTEIKHFSSIRQDYPNNASMPLDIFTAVNGRVAMDVMEATTEFYVCDYARGEKSETQTVTIDGREVLLWTQKSVIAPEKASKSYSDKYYFATAIDEETVIGFRVEVLYKDPSQCEINDSIVQILLSHCIFP